MCLRLYLLHVYQEWGIGTGRFLQLLKVHIISIPRI